MAGNEPFKEKSLIYDNSYYKIIYKNIKMIFFTNSSFNVFEAYLSVKKLKLEKVTF